MIFTPVVLVFVFFSPFFSPPFSSWVCGGFVFLDFMHYLGINFKPVVLVFVFFPPFFSPPFSSSVWHGFVCLDFMHYLGRIFRPVVLVFVFSSPCFPCTFLLSLPWSCIRGFLALPRDNFYACCPQVRVSSPFFLRWFCVLRLQLLPVDDLSPDVLVCISSRFFFLFIFFESALVSRF